MYRKLMQFAALILCVLLAQAGLADDTPAPVAVVQQAADALAKQLEGHKDEFRSDKAALYAMIDKILLPRFDRDYAAQLVLGRYWRTATDAQKRRFVDAFYNTLLQKYADGVLDFDESRIEILPYRGDPTEQRTSVNTIVTLDDGTRTPVNYALVKRDAGWLLFDVTIEGISYVRNFRAEMNSEIGTKGLDAVIERLETEAQTSDAGGNKDGS